MSTLSYHFPEFAIGAGVIVRSNRGEPNWRGQEICRANT